MNQVLVGILVMVLVAATLSLGFSIFTFTTRPQTITRLVLAEKIANPITADNVSTNNLIATQIESIGSTVTVPSTLQTQTLQVDQNLVLDGISITGALLTNIIRRHTWQKWVMVNQLKQSNNYTLTQNEGGTAVLTFDPTNVTFTTLTSGFYWVALFSNPVLTIDVALQGFSDSTPQTLVTLSAQQNFTQTIISLTTTQPIGLTPSSLSLSGSLSLALLPLL